MAFCKERTIPIEEYVSYVGRRFAPLWGEHLSVEEATKGAALNWVSVGCRLTGLSCDETYGEAMLADWPAQNYMKAHEISLAEADKLWEIFALIVKPSGLRYRWHRDGNVVTMVFEKAG